MNQHRPMLKMLNLNWFLVSNDTYISFVSWKNHAIPTRRFWVIGQYVKSVRDFFITRIQSFAKLVGTLAPWLTRSTAVIYSSVCVQVGTYTFMRTSLIIFLQRHTPPPSPLPQINVGVLLYLIHSTLVQGSGEIAL